MRGGMNRLLLGLAAIVALAACGGSVVEQNTGGAGTGAGPSTASNGTGVGGSSSGGPCPEQEPAGGSCAGVPDQLRCTYGDSVRPECRDAWLCSGGSWTTTKGECFEPPAGECGATQPGTQDVCANMGDVCTYGDTICICGCGGGIACEPPVDWECSGPPTTSGCPAAVPNDGTPCAAAGVQCNYGDVCSASGALVECTNGLWRWNTMIECAG
jgi:hypothetical protein